MTGLAKEPEKSKSQKLDVLKKEAYHLGQGLFPQSFQSPESGLEADSWLAKLMEAIMMAESEVEEKKKAGQTSVVVNKIGRKTPGKFMNA